MPIFASNRIGNTGIIANENYGYQDMGRILYEDAKNDMKVFNAALAVSFKEAVAIREGTMLESELRAMQEFSVKEAWENLKKLVKKTWEKIKGVFRKVYSQLSVWFVRDGKTFANMHRKTLAKRSHLDKCVIPSFRAKKADYASLMDSVVSKINKLDKEAAMSSGRADGAKDKTADDFLKDMTNDVFGKSLELSEIKEAVMDKCFETEKTEIEFGKLGVSYSTLLDDISGSGKELKTLKNDEKSIDKAMKNLIKSLDRCASNAKDDDADKDVYSIASRYTSAQRSLNTALSQAKIGAVKFWIKQARMVIGKLVGFTYQENAIFEEAMWLEGATDFDKVDEIPAEEAQADDVAHDPDIEKVNIEINVDAE